jgi:hypothetical protein
LPRVFADNFPPFFFRENHSNDFTIRFSQCWCKKGGKEGAKMRAEALTPEQRSQIARNAAKTRWAKARKKH